MSPGAHRDLLARADAALQRIDGTLARQEAALRDVFARMDERDRRAEERDAHATERHNQLMTEHRRLLDRFARSEDRVVATLSDLDREVGRNTSRIDDLTAAVRADTQAILAILDRLGPAPGSAEPGF